jgi:hypothetical protein
MPLGFFEFFDANGAKRRCVADIGTNGDITFYTKVEGGGGGGSSVVTFPSAQPVTFTNSSIAVDWTTGKPVNLFSGSNQLSINADGASRIFNLVGTPLFTQIVNNPLTVGFASAQPVTVGGTITVGFQQNQGVFLADATTTSQTLSINANGAALVRNTSAAPFFISDFGTQADAISLTGSFLARIRALADSIGLQADTASATGSLMARLRNLLVDNFGAAADAASAVGTLMARQRIMAQSYSQPNLFTRFGASATDTISGTPARLLGGCVWNKATAVRYLQFFNRATNPTAGTSALISRVLAPGEKYSWQSFDFGSNDGFLMSTGLAWGFSTTESTYTAGAPADVSVEVYWR